MSVELGSLKITWRRVKWKSDLQPLTKIKEFAWLEDAHLGLLFIDKAINIFLFNSWTFWHHKVFFKQSQLNAE